jgi:trk system potassium uptake protein TrkA
MQTRIKLPRKAHLSRKTAIVAGCTRFGAELALRLDTAGYPVVVVDPQKLALDQLDRSFSGLVVQGEAIDPDVLSQCAVNEAGMLLSVFDDDATNLLVGRIAKTIFHVPEVQVRLENGSNRAILSGTGIHVICPPEILSTMVLADLKMLEVTA